MTWQWFVLAAISLAFGLVLWPTMVAALPVSIICFAIGCYGLAQSRQRDRRTDA